MVKIKPLVFPGGSFVQSDADRKLVVWALMMQDRAMAQRSTGVRADDHIHVRAMLARARERVSDD